MSFTSNQAAEAAIRAELDQWLQAVGRKDIPAIMQHYAADIRAFDAIAKLQFRGVSDYTDHWHACLDYCPGDMVMRLQDVEVSASADLAFVSALCLCGMVAPDGKEDSGLMRMTACYQRGADGWKVVHEHFSSPLDPETNQALHGLQP